MPNKLQHELALAREPVFSNDVLCLTLIMTNIVCGVAENTRFPTVTMRPPDSERLDEQHQQRAVESLRDWSKWLIGIGLGAATGCVVVLQGGVKGPPRPFLLLAIASFTFAVITSIGLVRTLASLVEKLPLEDARGRSESIFNYPVKGNVSVRGLARMQLMLMILGAVCFLIWVLLKPAP